MAGSTDGIGSVGFQALPERTGGNGPFIFLECLDVGRRRRGRFIEDIVEDPFSSFHR
jgi:hypothetical protein